MISSPPSTSTRMVMRALLSAAPLALLLVVGLSPADGADNKVVWGQQQPQQMQPQPPPPQQQQPDVCAAFGAAPGHQICAKSMLFNSTLDHFDPTSSERWEHRYLFRDDDWGKATPLENGCPGPILLCTLRSSHLCATRLPPARAACMTLSAWCQPADTGNEGPITAFWGSNGFMVDYLAPKWGAMLVFPEERYYGTSLPFGSASFAAENLKYLTTEQILEDYVELIAHLKATIPKAAECPVVAFGGSYGGTLTTFLRAKCGASCSSSCMTPLLMQQQ